MATEGYEKAMGEEEAGALKLVNRLGESRSPYVRGHMNNPVAWQMWGKEALAMAKKSNRLLFVSIGYAACHCKTTPLTSLPHHHFFFPRSKR